MVALDTPVALFIFNRPDTTARVFEAIRAARPRKLLVVADGARADRLGEAERCAATRAIVERIDWDCQLITNYAAHNMGCRKRISSGLRWVFDTVEEAIILEDDCLPSQSFFPYCQELLARYRDDPRIQLISGNNFLGARSRPSDSYYFTKYTYIWGWASWRRAFELYDVDMAGWPALKQSGAMRAHCDRGEQRYWERRFDQTYAGVVDSWDYQMMFTAYAHDLLSIAPEKNLVSNIGFSPEGTHLALGDDATSNLPTHELGALRHPAHVERDREADRYVFRTIYQGTWRRVLGHLRRGFDRDGLAGFSHAFVDLAQRSLRLWRVARAARARV